MTTLMDGWAWYPTKFLLSRYLGLSMAVACIGIKKRSTSSRKSFSLLTIFINLKNKN